MPDTSYPNPISVTIINKKHGDYLRYHQAWDLMSLMYQGGTDIEVNAEQFLKKRPKEPSDVYQTRVERFNYENHAGSAVDYYLAAMFEKPPRVEPVSEMQAEPGETLDPRDTLDDVTKEFYDDFNDNCDRAGTNLIETMQEVLKDLLVYGRVAVLVDMKPGKPGQYASLAEQQSAGALDPYICVYEPRQILDWGKDETGNLNWIKFYARCMEQDTPVSAPKMYDYWYIFDREQFVTYRYEVALDDKGIPKPVPDEAKAELFDSGPHALSTQKKVPVLFKEVPPGMWFMNRAYLAIKNNVNVSNSLDWSLFMSALAMPVVQMDGEYSVQLSEAGFIKLPFNSKYGWSEPEGKAAALLMQRASDTMEQVYRAFFLIAQARGNKSTPSAQSGVSKQQDMAPSRKMLSKFGDQMRDVIQKLFNMVSDARGDDVKWDVRGLEFPEAPPDEMLDMVASAKAMDVQSDTFDRELDKTVVDAALPDANSAVKKAIYDEIDAAPSKSERADQEKQDKVAALLGGGPGVSALSAESQPASATGSKKGKAK